MKISTELEKRVGQSYALLLSFSETHQPITFANSLGLEDMVLTDMIFRRNLDIEIFTLDTGRLHEQTYQLLEQIQRQYNKLLKVQYPEARAIEHFVQEQGINAFYDNVDARKTCCRIRKVEPLKRALLGKKAWVTGLRREQSVTRDALQASEWDANFGLFKLNPLCDWSEQDAWQYIRHYKVPYNALHDQHFPSIGCSPCTRAIHDGEDIRAGRWWWEDPKNKECGLHAETKQTEPA